MCRSSRLGEVVEAPQAEALSKIPGSHSEDLLDGELGALGGGEANGACGCAAVTASRIASLHETD